MNKNTQWQKYSTAITADVKKNKVRQDVIVSSCLLGRSKNKRIKHMAKNSDIDSLHSSLWVNCISKDTLGGDILEK